MAPVCVAIPTKDANGPRRSASARLLPILVAAAACGWTAAHAGDNGVTSDPLRLVIPDALTFDADPDPLAETVDVDAAVSVSEPAGGLDMKLQWLSERYTAGGPEGPQIDANASGAEFGVNYKLESAVTIGALAQFEPAAEMLFGGRPVLSDRGWMAGPVTTVHLAPGLVLDARAAWGSAESGVDDLIGVGPAAQRRLLSARLADTHTFGPWRLTPSVNFSHFVERLPSAGPSPAEDQSRAAGSGRIDLAPELAYRIDMASNAFIEPKAVLGGFWTFGSLSELELGAGAPLEPRLKAEAGVTFGIVDGPKLQALGAVEESEGTAPDAWSGRVQLSVPLQ